MSILKKKLIFLLVSICLMSFFIACKKDSSKPKVTTGNITGMVIDISSDNPLTSDSAYVYLEDEIVAKTNASGEYTISSLEEGTYILVCSVLSDFFREETDTVEVVAGKTVTHNFYLVHLGFLYGEFQDAYFFDSLIVEHPEMSEWDEEEIFEGTTGATIIDKNLHLDVERAEVFLNDSLLDRADDWGVYGAALPAGSYTLRGSCAGGENLQYDDNIINVEILPDSIHYYNFFLSRKVISKIARR
jgi:hypothetical protein